MTPRGSRVEARRWWQLLRFSHGERERECLFVFMHHYFC